VSRVEIFGAKIQTSYFVILSFCHFKTEGDMGPRYETPIWDPPIWDPPFGTPPIWDPPFGTLIWDPHFGPLFWTRI
jgi:hypothetical protein